MSNPAGTEPQLQVVPPGAPRDPKVGGRSPLEIALKVVLGLAADRAVSWFGLLSSFGLFAWTLADPTLMRWGVATTYCVLIFVIPGLRSRDKEE